MNDTDMQQAIQKLREELRNERRSGASEGSSGSIQGSRGTSTTIGPTSQDTRTDTRGISRNTEELGSDYRSVESGTERNRQNRRRSKHDSSESANRGSEARRVGLARADDIPQGPLKTRVGSGLKEQAAETLGSIKQAIFSKKGSVLTKKEADEYYEPLKAAIQDNGESTDKLIEWKRGRPLNYPIWGNISDFEAECTAKIMIKRGMKSPYAAEAVRKFVDSRDWISIGVAYVPRIQMTVEALREKEVYENNNQQRGV